MIELPRLSKNISNATNSTNYIVQPNFELEIASSLGPAMLSTRGSKSMPYKQPTLLRNLVAGAALLAAGAAAGTWLTKEQEKAVELESNASGEESSDTKPIIKKSRRWLTPTERQKSLAEYREHRANAIAEELGNAFLPLPQQSIALFLRESRGLLTNDQPLNPTYKMCKVTSEDETKTFFMQIEAGDGQTAAIWNFRGHIRISNGSFTPTNFRYPLEGKLLDQRYEDIFVGKIAFSEGLADVPVVAAGVPQFKTTITKFGDCKDFSIS